MSDLPETFRAIWESLSTSAQATLLALLLTVFRVMYDDKDGRKWWRKLLECGICVCVTYGVSASLVAWGIREEGAWLVAVAMGWYGADYVRERGRRWSEKKAGDDELQNTGK